MARKEVHIELLLGKPVYALNGRQIGRLEEVRAEIDSGEAFVNEFLIGTYAVFERLAAWEIGRTFLGLFGSLLKTGHSIRWDQLDLSDPKHLRLTCEVSDLSLIKEE